MNRWSRASGTNKQCIAELSFCHNMMCLVAKRNRVTLLPQNWKRYETELQQNAWLPCDLKFRNYHEDVIIQRDTSSSRYAVFSFQYLQQKRSNHWMWRASQVPYPFRATILASCDYFLQEKLKVSVVHAPFKTIKRRKILSENSNLFRNIEWSLQEEEKFFFVYYREKGAVLVNIFPTKNRLQIWSLAELTNQIVKNFKVIALNFWLCFHQIFLNQLQNEVQYLTFVRSGSPSSSKNLQSFYI